MRAERRAASAASTVSAGTAFGAGDDASLSTTRRRPPTAADAVITMRALVSPKSCARNLANPSSERWTAAAMGGEALCVPGASSALLPASCAAARLACEAGESRLGVLSAPDPSKGMVVAVVVAGAAAVASAIRAEPLVASAPLGAVVVVVVAGVCKARGEKWGVRSAPKPLKGVACAPGSAASER